MKLIIIVAFIIGILLYWLLPGKVFKTGYKCEAFKQPLAWHYQEECWETPGIDCTWNKVTQLCE